MRKNLSFSLSKHKKNNISLILHEDENVVPTKKSPMPQIIINEISLNFMPLKQSRNNFDNKFLFPFDEKRSRSYSPIYKEIINNKKRPLSPAEIGNNIEVRTPKIQYSKRKKWFFERRDMINEKAIKLAKKIEELKFMQEKNRNLNREIKAVEYKRNRMVNYQQLQKDYKILSGLLFEVLVKQDKIQKEIENGQFQASNEFLGERIESLKKKNEKFNNFLQSIRGKILNFKLFKEFNIINLAIERENKKKEKNFSGMMKNYY